MVLQLENTFAQKAYGSHILVVGGGGARGAWAGGFVENLRKRSGMAYPAVFGTSTGSLLAPLIVLDDFAKLREAYTSVSQRDIFDHNPFNEETGELKTFNAIWRIIWGKETFGESNRLRQRMNTFLKQEDYNKIIHSAQNLQFTVSVLNMRTGKAVHISSTKVQDVEVMKDWMWASANEPLFMTYVRPKKGDTANGLYADGGVVDNVPLVTALNYALDNEAITDIDVIINKPPQPLIQQPPLSEHVSIIKGLQRLIDIWTLQVRDDNILIGLLQAYVASGCQPPQMALMKEESVASQSEEALKAFRKRYINIHTYYFPHEHFDSIAQKELLFNKERMNRMWEIGLNNEVDTVEKIIVPRGDIRNINTILKNSFNIR